jgi:hypothetical protein
MCACTETDVRESANDCTLNSGEGHSSRGETFHLLCCASPVSSSAERTVHSNTKDYVHKTVILIAEDNWSQGLDSV